MKEKGVNLKLASMLQKWTFVILSFGPDWRVKARQRVEDILSNEGLDRDINLLYKSIDSGDFIFVSRAFIFLDPPSGVFKKLKTKKPVDSGQRMLRILDVLSIVEIMEEALILHVRPPSVIFDLFVSGEESIVKRAEISLSRHFFPGNKKGFLKLRVSVDDVNGNLDNPRT